MKGIAAKMNTLSQEEIASFESSRKYQFALDGTEITVDADDVDIISEDMPGWLVANEGNLTVALEVELSDDLRKEGMARELINRIQNLRKESGLEITDRIIVTIAPNEQTDEAIRVYGDMIKGQVLANDIIVGENDGTVTDFDDFKLPILIKRDLRS